MKIVLLLLPFLILLTCTTAKKEIVQQKPPVKKISIPNAERFNLVSYLPLELNERRGFRYTIPENMEHDKKQAEMFSYEALLLEVGESYQTSSAVIAIRKTKPIEPMSILQFAKGDQSFLKQSVTPFYFGDWKPASLLNKDIPHTAYQFEYYQAGQKIYQRSVYVKDIDTFYIVSYSSLKKELIIDQTNDLFWDSIRID